MTVLFSWGEKDTTNLMAMLTLFGQTANEKYAAFYVNAARSSVIPTLFQYTRADGTSTIFSQTYELSSGNVNDLRQREILSVTIDMEGSDIFTTGLFDNSDRTSENALVDLFTTVFILIIWVLAKVSFVGPVMTLVSGETIVISFLALYRR